jgi:hypothetical protein
MADTNLAWFPLVLRERPPGRSLETRIAELTRLAEPDGNAPERTRITQAAEVFNKAALIASDCGLPDLAHALCDQQFEMFAQARPWTGWLPRLAIQPLLNSARQLIRDGHGDDAYAMLGSLHGAARTRRNLMIGGHAIDFRALTNSPRDHKALCTALWTALLADGTRALAQAGHWAEAEEQAEAHHGIGARLLDGRQISIIARLNEGKTAEAAMLVEQSHAIEPWENAVQCILRVLCRDAGGDAIRETDRMLTSVYDMIQLANANTTAACARVGIVALDLATAYEHPKVRTLHDDVLLLTEQDSYAARDALGRTGFSGRLTAEQSRRLHELVRDSGLGGGSIPALFHAQLSAAVERAATTLLAGLACGVNGDVIGKLPAWVRVLIPGSRRDAARCGPRLGSVTPWLQPRPTKMRLASCGPRWSTRSGRRRRSRTGLDKR